MAGYSGTPLAKKLGIKPGAAIYLVAAPGHYDELLAPLPEGVRRVPKIDDADVALPLGLVDIKVCSVDETWSGLKLVIRKQLRRAPGRSRS